MINEPGSLVGQDARRLNHGRHFRRFDLHGLKFSRCLPEGLPLFDMSNRLIKSALIHTNALRCCQNPVNIEKIHKLRRNIVRIVILPLGL
jgi:hypothetical protein